MTVLANDPLLAGHLDFGVVLIVIVKAAIVLGPRGKAFTVDSIGSALAGRAIGEHLRSMGEVTSGPPPFQALDRSRFLSALDEAVHRARRAPR